LRTKYCQRCPDGRRASELIVVGCEMAIKLNSWSGDKNMKSVNEQVILAYVQELSQSFTPSSFWTIVSMLKASLQIKEKSGISHRECYVEDSVEKKLTVDPRG
jgi:hypothetical protein